MRVDEVLNSVLEEMCLPSTPPLPLDAVECWVREALDVRALLAVAAEDTHLHRGSLGAG